MTPYDPRCRSLISESIRSSRLYRTLCKRNGRRRPNVMFASSTIRMILCIRTCGRSLALRNKIVAAVISWPIVGLRAFTLAPAPMVLSNVKIRKISDHAHRAYHEGSCWYTLPVSTHCILSFARYHSRTAEYRGNCRVTRSRACTHRQLAST